MAGGKTNTQRIEALEGKTSDMSARLEVHDAHIQALTAFLAKGTAAAEGHTSKITVIEQQLLVLVDLKGSLTAISSIDKDLALLKKDVEALQKWKDEWKKEKEETTRRWWAFGPNITAALIGGLITLLGVGINVALTF